MASDRPHSAPSQDKRFWLYLLLLLALVAAGLAVRLWRISDGDLTEDEELATSLPLLGYSDLFTSIAGRPPLAFLAQKFMVDLLGSTSPFALRLAGVLEGSLAIAVLFGFVRSVGGNLPALIAAALLACSAFHIEWSRDARYYPMLALTATICLWGFWSAGVQRRPLGFALVFLGFVATALTHFSGYLFCAAIVATVPFLLVMPEWRSLLLRHPRRVMEAFAALLLCALPLVWLLRGYLKNVTKHIAWPDLTQPLPPLFDITPSFLRLRLEDALGVDGGWLLLALFLVLAGLAFGTRRSPIWLPLSLCVLVLPFLLFFLFPPKHPWHIKYFIYQLPVLLANLALGIEAIRQGVLKRLPQQPVLAPYLAHASATTLVLILIASNLLHVNQLYSHPVTAHQQLGADLETWPAADDTYYCTWPERPRILRHYAAPLHNPGRLQVLRADAPFPSPLPDGGPAPWFLLDGKSDTSAMLATELLSGRYSRIPYENIFLARAPGIQQVPMEISLAPGERRSFELLSPRTASRALRFDVAAALGGRFTAQLNDGEIWTVRSKDVRRMTTAGRTELPRGTVMLKLENVGTVPVQCHAFALVPCLDEGTPLRIPAWDFLSLTGASGLEAVWPNALPEGTLVRDLRHGQVLAYRFYNAKPQEVVVRLHGLNDPPLSNQYQLYLENTKLQYEKLEFSKEDGSLTWESSRPFQLPQGDLTLHVGYIGMSQETFLQETRNGRAQTMETLQNPGLLELEIAPSKP